MKRFWIRGFAVVLVLALVVSLWPSMAVGESATSKAGQEDVAVTTRHLKPKDMPNPFDYKRLLQRERLLMQGRTAEAAALAKTGKDKLLVILVEFGGTDVATWSPGDMWDPIGDPEEVDYEDYGDCSSVITATQTFTYTGPLHNQLPKPTSKEHPGYDSIWTEDFAAEFYQEMLFGDGVFSTYTLEDGELVTIDLRGYTLKSYYEEQSGGLYTVDGDVIGWVQVPHSEAWYGADLCPGARSADYSGLADGYFPEGGDPRDLVKHALDAAVAAYPDLDWAQYDGDGDGLLDRVMFVHAGIGEEESPAFLRETGIGEHAIWSHSWTVYPFYDIGDTGLQVGPYTMMTENGTVGLFAHEFAHDLGTIDLYAYNPGETSVGFWSLMSDDWGGGWPASTIPPGLDPWHKYLLGWNDPVVLNTHSPVTEVTLGQACDPPVGTDDVVMIQLPPQIEQAVPPANGEYMWWGGRDAWLDAKLTLAAPLDLTDATEATLSFSTFYDIEEGWDFGFVQASTDGGETWTSLVGTTTTDQHDPDCFFIEEMPGYTGFSGDWLDEEVDLSAYAGQSSVLLRFRYETDPYTLGYGWYLDDIAITVDGESVFADDAEHATAQWVAEEWTRTDGYSAYHHYYLAEWRNASGFDAGLETGRYGIKDFGMLLWYRNTMYTENEVFDHLADGPGFGPKGACLLVDAHPEPLRSTTSDYVNEVANLHGRVQMRDAAFGLRDTEPFHVAERWRLENPDEEFPSRPSVSTFHDALGWYPGLEFAVRGPGDDRVAWLTKDWDASCVVPAKYWYGVAPPEYPESEALRFDGEEYEGGLSAWYWYPFGIGYGGGTGNPGEAAYGVHIDVLEEAADLSWGKVRVWNDTDTFLGWMKVDKKIAALGDVLTYEILIKDAASQPALATMEMPIPQGTTFVEGSLSGASFVVDQADPSLTDGGRVLWGGRAGGRVLHTADAHITYQVVVNDDARCGIHNEGLLTIGDRSYTLTAATQLPCVFLPLVYSAPGTAAPPYTQ